MKATTRIGLCLCGGCSSASMRLAGCPRGTFFHTLSYAPRTSALCARLPSACIPRSNYSRYATSDVPKYNFEDWHKMIFGTTTRERSEKLLERIHKEYKDPTVKEQVKFFCQLPFCFSTCAVLGMALSDYRCSLFFQKSVLFLLRIDL
jgi:hypothetical protein